MAKPKPQPVPCSGEVLTGDSPELRDYFPAFKDNFTLSNWSSPEKFARYIKTADKTKVWQRSGLDDGQERWYGTKTLDEALKFAEEGWKEGAERVERMRALISAQMPRKMRAVKYGIAGSVPNVARAVAGNILNMKQDDMAKSRKRPIITLLCNMSVNCGISADAITNRAAVIATVIDEIEAAGFACEVITTATSKGWRKEGYKAATSIVLKRSDQPVDIGRLAFGLGHAAMFRRMVFVDWVLEHRNKYGLGSGLGHSQEPGTYEQLAEKGVYLIPSVEKVSKKFTDEDTSAKEGLQYIIGELRKQKCPAFPPLDAEPDKFGGMNDTLDYDDDDDDDY